MKLIHQYSDETTIRECSEAPSSTTCDAEEKAEGDIDGPDDHEEDEAGPDLGHAPVRLTAGHLTHLNGQGVQEKCFFSPRNFSNLDCFSNSQISICDPFPNSLTDSMDMTYMQGVH